MRSLSNWRALFAMALIGLTALAVTACGGSSDSSSSESTTAAAEESSGSEETAASEEGGEEEAEAGAEEEGEAGGEEIVPEPPTEPPTELPVTEPLKKTPPEKQNVIWLACSLSTCQGDLTNGYKDASAALGWGFEKINYNTLKAAEGVQTALNKNPDTIFITGIEPAYFEAQAKEAIKKEIPIFNGFVLEEPEPEKNGMYMNYLNKHGYGVEAKQMAAWMINDSGGKANVVSVVIPEYPILKGEYEAIAEEFENCPGCKLNELAVTVEELESGKVPSKIAAYMQQNPETDYIEFTFSDLLTGAEAALEAAGIEGVKFTGVQSNPTIVKEIVEGKVAAWTAQPQEFQGWISVDAAIRNHQGEGLTKYEESGEIPTWVIDSPEQAEGVLEEGGEWEGPKGFKEKFEELWGI
jgi:ribose transport system substrate-binding protein